MKNGNGNGFKLKQQVKFVIKHGLGVCKGKGTIVKLVPKTITRGVGRLTVKMADGEIRRPYPSQCKVIA